MGRLTETFDEEFADWEPEDWRYFGAKALVRAVFDRKRFTSKAQDNYLAKLRRVNGSPAAAEERRPGAV